MRFKLVLITITAGFLALVARLFTIQIVKHEDYLILAEDQRFSSRVLPANRGKVYASGGVLVTNEDAFHFFADPSLTENDEEIAEKVAPLLLQDPRFFSYNPLSNELLEAEDAPSPEDLLKERLIERLANKERRWVSLARKVPRSVKERIEELAIEGIGFEEDLRRFYPEGSLAANVLGMVAFNDSGNDQGYFGLEGYYDGDLGGVAGSMAQEYSASGEPILVGGYEFLQPYNGSDLYLTIDRNIQGILERKIEEGVKRYGAESGCFVVLEPSTGRILAMGNYPTFDPGNFNPLTPPDVEDLSEQEFRNLAIATTYEPGSVMKTVLMAAAIDTGTVEPTTTFMDDGPLQVGGYTVDTFNGKHYGEQTMIELLQKSNNVGAATVALQLGKDTLRNYFLKFGFGEPLGVDLEGEEGGKVKTRVQWREIDLANAGFGQGVAVTPLQMANSVAAIANGGVLMKPYVVEKATTPSGREIAFDPEPLRRVISPESAETLVEMFVEAVEGGEARRYISQRYRIAGKTGTAQIPVKGGYDPYKTNVTFVGFLPQDRSFVMLVRLTKPTASTFSADTVVPLWVEAMEEVAPLFGVRPDK
jgi:cell division protein FtsI/penicillin-binding protein 2